MTDMIERVAAALWNDRCPGEEWNVYDKIDFLGHARAAIEAMREPTFDPENVSYTHDMSRADWWRAMVDAALTTGEQPK